MTTKEKHAYLDLSGEIVYPEAEESEAEVNTLLNKISDKELMMELDSAIGYLIITHEYKGYEIGRATA